MFAWLDEQNSVELVFRFCCEQPACDTQILHVYGRTTRVTSSCVREYVLWIHVRIQLRAFGTIRDRDSSHPPFPSFLPFVDRRNLAVLSFDEESIEFVQKTRYIHIFVHKKEMNNHFAYFRFQFQKRKIVLFDRRCERRISYLLPSRSHIYNIVCRSCVLSLFIHKTMCSLRCAWTTINVRSLRLLVGVARRRVFRKNEKIEKENERCCVSVYTDRTAVVVSTRLTSVFTSSIRVQNRLTESREALANNCLLYTSDAADD